MEDHKIIQLFCTRDETALEETAKKYNRYCTQIAYNILANLEDSKECVNDALLGAWHKIPPHIPEKLSSFLGRITRNIALDKYDYNTAEKRNKKFETLLDELNECLSSANNVERQYEEGEIAKSISTFLHSSNKEHRNMFLRRYWYSDSISDIASRFEVSESKVKSILFRTRNKLKIYLMKEGFVV